MTNAGSRIEVHITKDPLVTIELAGVGVKLAMVIESTDVTPSVARDLSGAGSLQLVFTKPDKTEVTQTAVYADFGTFTGTGSDGAIMYVTASASDIDQIGMWKMQAKITDSAGVIYSSEKIYFVVRA